MTRNGLFSEEFHSFDSYCLRWKRRNGSDQFQHCVRAQSITDAISRSREEVSLALGSNVGFWQMEEPQQRPVGDYRPSADQSVRSARPAVCSVAANLLALGLVLFAFHRWTSRPPQAVASQANIQGGAQSKVIAPDVHSEQTHVMRYWKGFIQATKITEVRAPRAGQFRPEDLEIGHWVEVGQLLGILKSQGGSLEGGQEPDSDDFTVNANSIVSAPVSGVIVDRAVRHTDEVSNGAALLQIADATGLRVDLLYPPGSIESNGRCEIWRSSSFVSFVDTSPTKAGERVLKLQSASFASQILPGAQVEVRCSKRELIQRLSVPLEAIRFERTAQVATIRSDGAIHLQAVELGDSIGGKVQIVAGLSPDVRLLSPLLGAVREGDRVDVTAFRGW
jgi:biotin carboxyl carrier protein